MTTAIVPAAGRSRRMGRPKLLLPFGEGTVLGATVAALAAGGADRIVVVTRRDDRRLAAWLRHGAAREAVKPAALVLAVNPDPDRGMLSSILAGLEAVGGGELREPVLVCPADLPALSPGTVRAVVEALASSGRPLAVPTHEDRRGHPLAVAPRLLPEIAALDLDVGLRQLLERHPDDVLEVRVDDPGCIRDVDTPADYRELSGTGPSARTSE